MAMTDKQVVTLLESFGEFLNPWLEVCFFSEGKTVTSFNLLSTHKQDTLLPKELPALPTIEILGNGKKVKTQYIESISEKGEKGIIRLRFDITWLSSGFDEIQRFLSKAVKEIPQNPAWEVAINQQIESYLKVKDLQLDALTKLEKRELILTLHEKGLLHYKDATLWLSHRFKLSRATIYNYLNWAKSVRKIHIHQVDAFSDAPFAGNPAGVVLDADVLEEETMRSITREMNNAETAFVLASEKADFKLRYFTPKGQEMVFCGHSTVGALYMLAKEQRLNMRLPGHYPFKVETQAGILVMGCDLSEEGDIAVNFNCPTIKLKPSSLDILEIAELLGLPLNAFNQSHQLYYEETNKDLYLSVKNLKDLELIECDFKATAKFCKNHDITVICVLTPHAFANENQIHMRCFAPAVGIDEDLFTGSVIGGLIAFAHKNKLITKEKGEVGIEQGHFLSRPGTVKVKYSHHQGEYQAEVFAKAKHFFSTEIQLT